MKQLRRLKDAAGTQGYVYQYYFVGQRAALATDPETLATEFVFDVTSDRKVTYAVSVFLPEKAVAMWAANHRRPLTDAAASMTVLEILETLEPSPGLIGACRHLKACGFRLALDDFTWKPGIEPLVEIADYIKVDFVISGKQERRELLQQLRGVTVALIAEKIETQAHYLQACDEGFTLMQGFYFCRPVLMRNHKVPANRLQHIEILRVLQDETMDLHELAGLVKRDTCLTYRLLRLINSPVSAMRQWANFTASSAARTMRPRQGRRPRSPPSKRIMRQSWRAGRRLNPPTFRPSTRN